MRWLIFFSPSKGVCLGRNLSKSSPAPYPKHQAALPCACVDSPLRARPTNPGWLALLGLAQNKKPGQESRLLPRAHVDIRTPCSELHHETASGIRTGSSGQDAPTADLRVEQDVWKLGEVMKLYKGQAKGEKSLKQVVRPLGDRFEGLC